jgi:hypothetical protein
VVEDAPGGTVAPPSIDATAVELRRRRVFLFFGAVLIFAVAGLLFEESDMWTHAIDDVALVGVGLAILILLVWGRREEALAAVRRQNNLVTVLLVVALAFQIAAFPIEMSDAMDFGNEPPLLIVLVIAIANRFIP